MTGSFHMIMIVLAAGLVAAVAATASSGGWIPEAAAKHESYWVLEPHEQLVTGSRGEVVSRKTTYVNRTYTVPHPPPPAAYLEGCQRTPGYIYWWHSNATHRLTDPGYVPFMEYGIHYANASKVMPDLQARIDAGSGSNGTDLCVTAILTVSAVPGGLVYAGEDVHGGANATLHAVAGFLQDRGAVLEDHWDWDYGVEYPPVDPGLRGGPYPGSEYPDHKFGYRGSSTPGPFTKSPFIEHQLKYQISARIPPALVDELVTRPDVVALDVYGKWVGTPEFMFYNTDAMDQHIAEKIARGVNPIKIVIFVDEVGPSHKKAFFSCPHRCFNEWTVVDRADRYYDGMLDHHTEWLISFIKERGGKVIMRKYDGMSDLFRYRSIAAEVSPALAKDLDKLRIVSSMSFAHIIKAMNMNPPMISEVTETATVVDTSSNGTMQEKRVSDGNMGNTTPHKHDPSILEEPRCGSDKVPFERPVRGDTVCVYPGTADRLEARGPW